MKWIEGAYMQLYLFNPDSNRIGSYLPNPWLEDLKDRKISLYAHQGKHMLTIANDIACYKYILNDTVYKISNKEIKPFFIMDMERSLTLKDYLEKPNTENLNREILIYSARAFKNHLMFWLIKNLFNDSKESFLCLYDLRTGKLSYHDYMVLNDLDGGPNFGGPSVFELPMLKNPSEEIREFYYGGHDNIELKFPERKNEFQKLLDMSDEEDNPIIRIVSFRDDF
jgi:hypothetical protein